jgi:hypothetical protein
VLNPHKLHKIREAANKAAEGFKPSDSLNADGSELNVPGAVTIHARFGQAMASDAMLYMFDPAHFDQLPLMLEEYKNGLPSKKGGVCIDTDFPPAMGNAAGAMAAEVTVPQLRQKKKFFGGLLMTEITDKAGKHYGGIKKSLTHQLPDPIFREMLAARNAHPNTAWVRERVGPDCYMSSNDPAYRTGLLELVRAHSEKKTTSDAKPPRAMTAASSAVNTCGATRSVRDPTAAVPQQAPIQSNGRGGGGGASMHPGFLLCDAPSYFGGSEPGLLPLPDLKSAQSFATVSSDVFDGGWEGLQMDDGGMGNMGGMPGFGVLPSGFGQWNLAAEPGGTPRSGLRIGSAAGTPLRGSQPRSQPGSQPAATVSLSVDDLINLGAASFSAGRQSVASAPPPPSPMLKEQMNELKEEITERVLSGVHSEFKSAERSADRREQESQRAASKRGQRFESRLNANLESVGERIDAGQRANVRRFDAVDESNADLGAKVDGVATNLTAFRAETRANRLADKLADKREQLAKAAEAARAAHEKCVAKGEAEIAQCEREEERHSETMGALEKMHEQNVLASRKVVAAVESGISAPPPPSVVRTPVGDWSTEELYAELAKREPAVEPPLTAEAPEEPAEAPARGLTAGRLASVNKRQSEAVSNHVKRAKATKAIVDSPGALQFPQNKKGRGL